MTMCLKVVCFQMLGFETSNSKPEFSKSNSCKITSFVKTTLLQWESFLTMFYTTNSSPLPITKYGVMLTIILSVTNSVQCMPLNAPDTVTNSSLWSDVVFEKDVFFHSNNKIIQLKFFLCIWKHKVMQRGCFFFHYSFVTSWTNWALIFTCLLFNA